jgi:TrmH RNA methyltransferase
MRNKLSAELAVCGFNAVKALGERHPGKIRRFFLREDRLPAFTGLCRGLAERRLPYKICGDEELERLCKSAAHQGLVAMIGFPEAPPLSGEDLEAWAREGKTGLLLHSVGNDHNLGALVRSAAFFDAPLVVLAGEDPGARLSTSAYRVAEGGMEYVEFRSLRNTAAFLRDASPRLLTVGTDPRARLRAGDLGAALEARRSPGGGRPGLALVLGNEEAGLPREVKEQCGLLVRVPGTGNLESLNVAQAAAIFLHELYRIS